MSLGWKLSNSALLAPRSGHQVFAFNERVFAIGGQSSGSAASLLVESAVVDQGGTVNQFKVTAALPPALNAGRSNFGLAQSALSGLNRIYVLGGENPAGTVAYTDVAIGLVNTDGSILWTVGTPLPSVLGSVRAAIVGSWLYAVGGDNLAASGAQATLVEQDITYTAVASGTGGNAITIAYVNPGTDNASLSVTVATNAITVHLATDGSAVATSTATQIQAAVAGSIPASALVTAAVTGTGSNVEAVVSATHLAGGVNATNLVSNVLASKIQSDGSLGPWLASPTPFPGGGTEGGKITGHLAMGSKTYLYVGGGIPKGGTASQFVYRGIPQQGSGQLIAWDKEQLGMSTPRVHAGAPTLLLGPLAIVGGSTTGAAAQALASDDELRLSGDGRINQLVPEDTLPTPLMGAKVCALNNQVFAIGGQNTAGTYLSSIYQATLQSNLTV